MPMYQFKNLDTDEEWEDIMTNSARESFLSENPRVVQIIGAPGFISGYHLKPDSSFNDLLKQTKKRNYGSNIETF